MITMTLYVRQQKKHRCKEKTLGLCGVRSTVWTAQRCSQSYTEKRRRRKETEVARRIKGGIKRRGTDPASNQFLKCSPPSGIHKEIHRVG